MRENHGQYQTNGTGIGWHFDQIIYDHAPRFDEFYNRLPIYFCRYGKRLLIVGIGHNDFAISGLSTETFLAQLYAYTDARRADGIKVAVMSVPPSTFSGLNAWRSIVNSDIENNVGIHLDYYVDLALTSIGADADGADTSKYVDGTHPTAATAIVMAQAIIDQAIEIEDAL